MKYCSKDFKFYFFFISILFSYTTLAAIEGVKCENKDKFDTDQVVFFQDFGREGIRGPVNITIANTLQVGGVVSVVTKSETRGSVNLIADDIYVLHVDARIQMNELVMSTSKRLNLEWHAGRTLTNPVLKNAKTTTTIVYEPEGFRIFINGREIAFYEHVSDKVPRVINLQHDYVYKVMYLTTVETGKR